MENAERRAMIMESANAENGFTPLPSIEKSEGLGAEPSEEKQEELKPEEGDFEVLVMMKINQIQREQYEIKMDNRVIGKYLDDINKRLYNLEKLCSDGIMRR